MAPVIEHHQEAIRVLCERHHVAYLDVFGSAAADAFEPGRSDVDFLVAFRPCTPREHYDRYFGLVEDLEALLKLPVDLVERSALRNPHFIAEVEATRQTLYAA